MASDQSPLQKGLECLKANRIDEAIAHLERATAFAPDDYQAFNYLGVAYAQKGLYDRAVGAFQTAVHLRPNVASMHYNLGLAYQADGFPDRAMEEFRQALEIDPGYTKAAEAIKALEAASSGDSASAQSCVRHMDEPAVARCSFCHLPICRECVTMVGGQVFCPACASKQ